MVYNDHNEKLSAIVIGSFTASVTVPPEVNGTGKKKKISVDVMVKVWGQ